MSSNLNNVKMTKPSRPYHHGDLRAALIAAAEAVITERGVDGFSLREAARRAGVSPAAPGHHFGDARGLLTAVATAAFTELGDVLAAAAAIAGDRRTRLEAQGAAYVGFALAHPAAFDLMWRRAVVDAADPDFFAAGRRAFAMLDTVIRDGQPPIADPLDPALAPTVAAWSLVHGFAKLAVEDVFGSDPGTRQRAAAALLPAVLASLDI